MWGWYGWYKQRLWGSRLIKRKYKKVLYVLPNARKYITRVWLQKPLCSWLRFTVFNNKSVKWWTMQQYWVSELVLLALLTGLSAVVYSWVLQSVLVDRNNISTSLLLSFRVIFIEQASEMLLEHHVDQF